MAPIEALVRKHPVLTYFVLTFTISWGGVLLVIGGGTGQPPVPAGAAGDGGRPQRQRGSLDLPDRRKTGPSGAWIAVAEMAGGDPLVCSCTARCAAGRDCDHADAFALLLGIPSRTVRRGRWDRGSDARSGGGLDGGLL